MFLVRYRVTLVIIKDSFLGDQIGKGLLVVCSASLDGAEVVLSMLGYRVVMPFQVSMLR